MERLDRLTDSYSDLLKLAERQSRRFRKRYAHMTSRRYSLEDVRAYGRRWRETLRTASARKRAEKKASHTGG